MSLTEMLPELQSLSRLDKIRLIQFLARDLERNEADLIEPGRSYPVWSPDRAFGAAAALLRALEDERASHDQLGPTIPLCARHPLSGMPASRPVADDLDRSAQRHRLRPRG